MKTSSLDFICCPVCKGILTFPVLKTSAVIPSEYHCEKCGLKYFLNNGYLDFLGDNEILLKSKRERIIRSVYARFYTPSTDFMFIFCGGAKNARREVIDQLELNDGAVILETGMGPGDNFPWLTARAKNLTIFGIDIQKQMMIHSIRNIRKWKTDAELFRADAEDLPFRDEKFDVVFHLGAFNLFTNKNKAVSEMIRVAKPGTRIVIADESEKGTRIFNKLTGSKAKFEPPLAFVPGNMMNITEKMIWRGYGYVIAFTKPHL